MDRIKIYMSKAIVRTLENCQSIHTLPCQSITICIWVHMYFMANESIVSVQLCVCVCGIQHSVFACIAKLERKRKR